MRTSLLAAHIILVLAQTSLHAMAENRGTGSGGTGAGRGGVNGVSSAAGDLVGTANAAASGATTAVGNMAGSASNTASGLVGTAAAVAAGAANAARNTADVATSAATSTVGSGVGSLSSGNFVGSALGSTPNVVGATVGNFANSPVSMAPGVIPGTALKVAPPTPYPPPFIYLYRQKLKLKKSSLLIKKPVAGKPSSTRAKRIENDPGRADIINALNRLSTPDYQALKLNCMHIVRSPRGFSRAHVEVCKIAVAR
jgi:hypothetical protein